MLLVAAAVIPAVFLMVRVYRADRLEKEPIGLLLTLILLGIISTLLASITEWVGENLLELLLPADGLLYALLLNFVVVGLSEEGFKYLVLKRRTWRSPEFNCQFDGVVYAVFVSLGFALWENLGYVAAYGMETALARAVTAVPGHACFGVFMGVWYGIARRWELYGESHLSKRARRAAVVVPTLLHGFYDFIASMERDWFVLVFLVFVLLLFITAMRLVRRLSKDDHYL